MADLTVQALEAALPAIGSTLKKSEKALLKLKAGTYQHTMTARSIKAYGIAIELIKRELAASTTEDSVVVQFTKEELEEALEAIASASGRVEKIQPQFRAGTPQHTLAVRRIKAFCIATELMNMELKTLAR